MKDRAKDEAVVVRVARGAAVIGDFYLSYVELSLKSGTFLNDDWGWIECMCDWEPLGELTPRLRSNQGKKRLATSAQRAYLKRCGFEPWRGMSNREAHAVLNTLIETYEVTPGAWMQHPISEAQVAFLNQLGVEFCPNWTKGEASLAISKRLEELDGHDFTRI
jgi:hypothetical protein